LRRLPGCTARRHGRRDHGLQPLRDLGRLLPALRLALERGREPEHLLLAPPRPALLLALRLELERRTETAR